MRTFLLWSTPKGCRRALAPEAVANRLQERFSPLFTEQPRIKILETASASLVLLQLPVAGWKPPFLEQDGPSWALAIDYPLNARTVLRRNDIRFGQDNVLLRLCRSLSRDPARVLKDLAPPFSLLWSKETTGEIMFQNDGLGQSQVFEYRDDRLWALTNRICALGALGLTPEPEPEHWATRFTLGWFPLDMTGFKNTRFVGPATQMRVDEDGVHCCRHDVLSDWVQPEARSKKECLELARSSVLQMSREIMALWQQPSLGLSGGWDSRAITAALRHLGADFTARVRGNPERYDVMIAQELARIARFPLRIKTSSGLPPASTDGCRRSIRRALLWQAGYMDTIKHKGFLARKKHLNGGVVNVMGQHGGLGKADFAVKIRAHELEPHRYEDRLLEATMKAQPSFLRPEWSVRTADVIRQAYRESDRYGLAGLARLHFFFLHEYTRRWSSGSLSGQTGLIFAPYMNPDFIRACYAYPPSELPDKPFHRYITATLAPDWAKVPYADEVTAEDLREGLIRPVRVKSRKRVEFDGSTRWKRPRAHKKYWYRAYWEDVGGPIILEALEAGGFWTTVFEPLAASADWASAPDALAIAHLLPGVMRQYA